MNEIINKMYQLLEECEAKDISQREESIVLLNESFSLYEQIIKEKGLSYCYKRCSDVPSRMNGLINKLMEHNS